MKIAVASLFSFCFLFGWSQTDSTENYKKIEIDKHQLKVLYGYLGQDGNHSAVTGGEGTEELAVQTSRIIYVKRIDSTSKWILKGGVDYISSASTDNIDFFVSSASKKDFRVHADVGRDFTSKNDTNTVGVNIRASLESDYFSRGIGGKYSHKNKYGGVTEVRGNYYWDELRWGIVTQGIFDFYTLVYPQELRDTSWFDISHRNTVSLSGKHTFITSKRGRFGVMADVIYQQGILGTPFHRVYFTDNSLRVERLPFNRVKLPISVQYNHFLWSGLIVKNYVRYGWDSFGINSLTYQIQTPIKLKYWLWLKPFVRYYNQTSATYFKPYGMHDIKQEFYTSDYDLSQFNSINYGLGIRIRKIANWKSLKGLEFLIEKYDRSDGLYFWQTSALIDVSF